MLTLLVLWNSRFLLALRLFLQSLQCLIFLIDRSHQFKTPLGNIFESILVKIIIIAIAILVPFKKVNTCVKLLMAEFSTTVHERQKCNSYRSTWMTSVHLTGNFSAHKLNLKRHTAAANGHYKPVEQHHGSITKIQAERGRRFFSLHVRESHCSQSSAVHCVLSSHSRDLGSPSCSPITTSTSKVRGTRHPFGKSE